MDGRNSTEPRDEGEDDVPESCRLLDGEYGSKRQACGGCAERAKCPVARSVRPLASYMDCPTCPACGSRAGVPAVSFPCASQPTAPEPDRLLLCAVCDWYWIATREQVDQSKAAEAAWHARTDGRAGPWKMVLKLRAKKDGPQERLFRKEVKS